MNRSRARAHSESMIMGSAPGICVCERSFAASRSTRLSEVSPPSRELCTVRANHQGWIRESAGPQLGHRGPREDRLPLLERLRNRRDRRAAARGRHEAEGVDVTGHECAYYDTTLLFPVAAVQPTTDLTGVYVLDMTNPRVPVLTDNLLSPAMQSPHESFSINKKRGLLARLQ